MSRWTLHRGEAVTWLRTLPDASVDAVISDPPYSSGGQFRGDRAKSTAEKYVSKKSLRDGGGVARLDSFTGDNKDQRSFLLWSILWMSEALRIARPGAPIVIFTDWRQLPATTDAIQMSGWVWRGIHVWDKTEACRPTLGRPRSQCEYAAWGSNGEMPLHRDAPVLPGVYRAYQGGEDRHHQTQKPTGLMRQLVQICERGGLILDPFCGSGTTGVAALLEGRRFLGCEISPPYAQVARARLTAAEVGIELSAYGSEQTTLQFGGTE